ncbi:MAG: GrpB family protein [Dehalococcoidia bacterium]|nr:GrpB family protein [Chloroflexi bacterium CFX7]MCK6565742.1 GrpB family protein [Dehalococcoidia bacterium]NUQ54790.1 GrpB family protein [Dehalococcoidia bacterium]
MTAAHPNYRIVEHDPAWAAVFTAERERLAMALGLPPGRIEHIGSTAVPRLGAKPIVDIMAGAESEADYALHASRLAALGYEDRGETVPGTRYIRKAGPPRVNLHLTVFEAPFWVDHLLFRDFLREHGETAREYERLKRRILAEVGPDPPAYNAAKEAFINSVLSRARPGGCA